MLIQSNIDSNTARADLAACRTLLRGGSKTFFAASLLLPAKVRDPASALYAFCRLADDAVDCGDGVVADIIDRLRDRLDRAYAGRPSPLAADRAFAATVAQFNIPRALPEALIEGFEWDAAGRRYETLPDLLGYAARVAGSVGAMMTLVMGVDSPEVVSRACDLGMAMQLSNIARDVGEDARAGRIYLPLEWLRDAGIDPQAWMAYPVFSPALGVVIKRVLKEAELIYRGASAGIAYLPPLCRPAIRTAHLLYAEIGHEVERLGFDSVSRRAVVSSSRKLNVLARSLVEQKSSQTAALTIDAKEARFLIDAIVSREPAIGFAVGRIKPRRSRWSFDARVAWLVELFERLEKQERLRADPTWRPGYRSASVMGGPTQDRQPVAQL
jgi:phytoene synthase